MKKLLAISALLLVVSAPAFAQLNVAWNACPSATSVSTIADVCSAPAAAYGTMNLAAGVPNTTALDYVLDLQTTAPILPAFWQRSSGECAGGPGVGFRNFISPIVGDVGCAAVLGDMAGPFGSQLSVSSASWGSGPAIANIPDNRGKLVGSLVRSSPGTLNAGEQAVARWEFSNSPNPACAGCDTPAALVFNSVVIFSSSSASGASPEADPINLEGPGAHNNCAAVGGTGANLCGATPTQNTTWGQIKSLYR